MLELSWLCTWLHGNHDTSGQIYNTLSGLYDLMDVLNKYIPVLLLICLARMDISNHYYIEGQHATRSPFQAKHINPKSMFRGFVKATSKQCHIKLEARHWSEPVSLTFHSTLRKRNTEPSIAIAFGKVS